MSIQIAHRAPLLQPVAAGVVHAPVSLQVVAELLRGLNREQRAAVTHGEGPLVVIAGPGTGKTEVITRRVAWLIASKRARPQEVLALTFTENAAQEMQSRVDLLVPYGHANAGIHTFHAFGDRLIREHSFELGLPGDVRLISRAEAIVVLREHMFELGLDRYLPLGDPTRFLGALVDAFSRAKDEGVTPGELADRLARVAGDDAGEEDARAAHLELARAYERYQVVLAERGLIDHADQISLALRLVRERPAVRDAIVGRYRYVLVDEFQDMNRAQLEFVRELTSRQPNVTVVGDPNQAIYGFRGASATTMATFSAGQVAARRIQLRRNYRSRQPILDAAARLVSHSPTGDGQAARQVANRRGRFASPVRSVWFDSPEQESEAVAQQVAAILANGVQPRDVAVLTRSNGEAESMARSLAVHGVPVRTQLPENFFARPSVRPLLAFLRVAADPHQTMELYALATSHPYGLGGLELTDHLSRARRGHRSLWDVLREEASSDTGSQRGLRRLVEDVELAIQCSHSHTTGEILYQHLQRSGMLSKLASDPEESDATAVARFFEIVRARASLLQLDRVAAVVPHLDSLVEASDAAADAGPLDTNAVAVLTVHRAKGLEFRHVFVTGLTDGRFPARGRAAAIDLPWRELRGDDAPDEEVRLDEERRLCYVAMTRAQDELWLTHHLSGPGGRGRRRPSPFIAEALDTPSNRIPLDLDAAARIQALGTPMAASLPMVRTARPATEVSFSGIETYLECPERYRLRHVVGLPGPPHHALTYGSALHRAVAAYHLSVANGGRPLSEEELLDEYRRAWSPEGFLSREHEEARFAAGIEALRQFRAQQLESPSPTVAVERPFSVRVGDVVVHGRADRIDSTPEGDVIVDYKSSDVRDQRKADKKARESLQLQVYALAHEARTGRLPNAMQLHFLESGLSGTTRPDAERLDKARAKIGEAAQGIAGGRFDATPNAFACGYCPYRQVCAASVA